MTGRGWKIGGGNTVRGTVEFLTTTYLLVLDSKKVFGCTVCLTRLS